MEKENKFGMLRKILRAIGLSQQAADDAVNFISDLLVGERKEESGGPSAEFPYHLRDHFLSPAELSFYAVLCQAVANQAVTICPKVGLRDLFYVRQDDQSQFRIYTNKIDRKHVDFVLVDAVTMQPIVAIELDDKSHQRQDRQERDAFVDGVFQAARLPLLHVPVKRAYVCSELLALLAPYMPIPVTEADTVPTPAKAVKERVPIAPPANTVPDTPLCPKCGSSMMLRTAKSGANAGNRFWGCSDYPKCRSMLPYEGA